jgi:hypothetical protein
MIDINCVVVDRFNIVKDTKMLFLSDALDPIKVRETFQKNCALIDDKLQLIRIEVIRYKPEKRCLIEYHFQGKDYLVSIGKVRAKGLDIKSYQLQKQLWQNGFDARSDDGISVPEPIGVIPEWQMWLQKKVSGFLIIDYLIAKKGIKIARKVAQIAHKLHQANITPPRAHTMTDELAILEQKLPLVLVDYPQWEGRIKTILTKCHILGTSIAEYPVCGIHRDYYFDQIIVNKDRFYLLDFDLYCLGDINLDIGNFIAHLTEYSLRVFGDANILGDRELALEREFLKLTQQPDNRAIVVYTTLSLVRHIYLSNNFPQRRSFTQDLLTLCERRLNYVEI